MLVSVNSVKNTTPFMERSSPGTEVFSVSVAAIFGLLAIFTCLLRRTERTYLKSNSAKEIKAFEIRNPNVYSDRLQWVGTEDFYSKCCASASEDVSLYALSNG